MWHRGTALNHRDALHRADSRLYTAPGRQAVRIEAQEMTERRYTEVTNAHWAVTHSRTWPPPALQSLPSAITFWLYAIETEAGRFQRQYRLLQNEAKEIRAEHEAFMQRYIRHTQEQRDVLASFHLPDRHSLRLGRLYELDGQPNVLSARRPRDYWF